MKHANLLTAEDAAQALKVLHRYRQGKAHLERRVIEDERWYQLRHWEILRRQRKPGDVPTPEPTSAWLFNSLANKHADAMDNYPEASVLPREPSDEENARVLSAILPVILERAEFEEVYSRNWWEKLKHGTGVYGVFWDPSLDNGLGDVSVRDIDLLNLFWEPGITDIQRSKNVFLVTLEDDETLENLYPQLKGKLGKGSAELPSYCHDDAVDLSGKTAVVDWYYKLHTDGRTVLHYAKIVAGELVFASQNLPEYCERGWYDHGEYPFVFDTLFPEKGTPVGFGYVAVCRDPQLYIDRLSANIMETSLASSRLRFLVSDDTNINEEELRDWNKPVVHVGGRIDETKLKQLTTRGLDSIYVGVLKMKIDEMKETSSNRDVTQGSPTGGATAAAAIAALQEAGNKVSRDMLGGSYRRYARIGYLCIELVRQFYDEARSFRITGADGDWQFRNYSNAALREQRVGHDSGGKPLFRRPVFDLKLRVHKRSPFARESQNQRAMELYRAGFFEPKNAKSALICLEMMEFEGIEQVRRKVGENLERLEEVQQPRNDAAAAQAAPQDPRLRDPQMAWRRQVGL